MNCKFERRPKPLPLKPLTWSHDLLLGLAESPPRTATDAVEHSTPKADGTADDVPFSDPSRLSATDGDGLCGHWDTTVECKHAP